MAPSRCPRSGPDGRPLYCYQMPGAKQRQSGGNRSLAAARIPLLILATLFDLWQHFIQNSADTLWMVRFLVLQALCR
jgi:hypothetical protein